MYYMIKAKRATCSKMQMIMNTKRHFKFNTWDTDEAYAEEQKKNQIHKGLSVKMTNFINNSRPLRQSVCTHLVLNCGRVYRVFQMWCVGWVC